MPIKVDEKFFRRRWRWGLKRHGVVDMKKAEKLFTKVPGDVMFKVLEEVSSELAQAVRDWIEDQPPSWPPLNEKYREWKAKEGLDESMLIATQNYLDSIGVQEVRRGNRRIRVRVGVPNSIHEPSGMNYNKLGRIHEYGTSKIPARPHWGPAFDAWKRRMRHFTKRVERNIDEKLRDEIAKLTVKPQNAKKIKGK